MVVTTVPSWDSGTETTRVLKLVSLTILTPGKERRTLWVRRLTCDRRGPRSYRVGSLPYTEVRVRWGNLSLEKCVAPVRTKGTE